MGRHLVLKETVGPRTASPGGGGQLTLGCGVRGTTGSRVSCRGGGGGNLRGISHPTTPTQITVKMCKCYYRNDSVNQKMDQ